MKLLSVISLVAIGDVSGKGVPAAIHMTLIKGGLRYQALPGASPRDVLTNVNHHLYETFTRGKFASMIYATIDTEDMTLRFACAGQNPLLLLRDGSCISPQRTKGIALGLVGAMVGGFIFTSIGGSPINGFNLYSMFVAIIGAIVVLVLYHAITGRRGLR